MSKFLQPSLYKNRALETQWMNIIFQSHDLMCGCNKPHKHLQYLINSEQCRHFKDTDGEETGGMPEKEEPTFDEGDLEKLFATENDVDEG